MLDVGWKRGKKSQLNSLPLNIKSLFLVLRLLESWNQTLLYSIWGCIFCFEAPRWWTFKLMHRRHWCWHSITSLKTKGRLKVYFSFQSSWSLTLFERVSLFPDLFAFVSINQSRATPPSAPSLHDIMPSQRVFFTTTGVDPVFSEEARGSAADSRQRGQAAESRRGLSAEMSDHRRPGDGAEGRDESPSAPPGEYWGGGWG